VPVKEDRTEKVLQQLTSVEEIRKEEKQKQEEVQKAEEVEQERQRKKARRSVLDKLTGEEKDKTGGSDA